MKAVTETKGAGSFARRDHLNEIEAKVRDLWAKKGVFNHAEVPADADLNDKNKYFATFPYPYMNGRLHLGHAFTLTKAEFQARYQKLKGKNVLWPLAFHCTGMPIAAAANNLRREFNEAAEEAEEKVQQEQQQQDAPADNTDKIGVFSGKKTKLKAKTGNLTQFQILEKSGVPVELIPQFQDPNFWLSYFPPLGQQDLERFGMAVDWRRSFITTDVNPFYDQFIRWQFWRLKERGHILFGKRPSIFSPIDNQPCADHDRASGEGVKEQEYTLVKLRCIDVAANGKLPESTLAAIAGRPVFLVCATLRPETMYGQTNCFLLPDGEYSLVESKDGSEIYVTALRAARNMGWQDLIAMRAQEHSMKDAQDQLIPEPVVVATALGADLLGLPLQAPLALNRVVYSLPMFTISMEKGTGVVTSVPSDSPDDYATYRDLKTKAALREKYGLTEEMCQVELVDIIDIPGYGGRIAEVLVDQLKIASQNDKVKLAEAKEIAYNKGFYEGVMLVGAHKGQKVKDAKDLVKADLIASGDAMTYWEPDGKVMSRSGAECVVALADQWYLDYGEDKWRAAVEAHMASGLFSAWTPQAQRQFEEKVAWLGKWGCSRKFGLGTKMPWDEQFVVESLSDSTIYMAYYTIAHKLQGGYTNIDGKQVGPSGLTPEMMTPTVWDFIFAQTDDVPTELSAEHQQVVKEMRREFEYWYPMDLRVSGKDLIGNHLTMALYNHAAIWPNKAETMWPRNFVTNGHIMVDGEKMSKSLGNFLTLTECCAEFSADVTRLACADAGDTLDDANFSRTAANAAILRVYTFEELAAQLATIAAADARGEALDESNAALWNVITKTGATYRAASSPKTEADLMFENELRRLVGLAETAYAKMVYRDAARYAFYEFQSAKDAYRNHADGSVHIGSMALWLQLQVTILAPICPHLCEYVWSELLQKETPLAASQGAWPVEFASGFDALLSRKYNVVMKSVADFRAAKEKQAGGNRKKVSKGAAPAETPNFTRAVLYVATEYLPLQQEALHALRRCNWNGDFTTVPADLPKQLKADPELSSGRLTGKEVQQVMQFAMFMAKEVPARGEAALDLALPFDEAALMLEHQAYIKRALGVDTLEVRLATDEPHPEDSVPARKDSATPSSPAIVFLE